MTEHGEGGPVIIAVCGKGGVGKTTISALMARVLSEDTSARVLAIDADPAGGLGFSLGFEVPRTLDDIRLELISQMEEGSKESPEDVRMRMDYRVAQSLGERGNMAFMSIGRPEGEGCYCRVNSLLRDILTSIAAGFDYVVIDGEAGIEQVNRRVMEGVTHLVMVSDLSMKGLRVVENLKEVADRMVHYKGAGLIVNRIHNDESTLNLQVPPGIHVIGTIPESDTLRRLDMDGISMTQMPEGPVLEQVRHSLEKLTGIPRRSFQI